MASFRLTPILTGRQADRFWGKATPVSGGCLEWQAYKQDNGYGTVRLLGATWMAHRVAYATARGALSPVLTIDHLCRNRACINPAHLEAVTGRENVLRGATPAAANAAKTECPRHETPYDVIRADGRRGCRACDREKASRYNLAHPEAAAAATRRYRARRAA